MTHDLTEYKYLFFNFDLDENLLSKSVCIKECPNADTQVIECFPTKNIPDCSDLYTYDTFKLLDRYCLPTKKDSLELVGAYFSGINFESALEAIYVNRYVLLGSLLFAFMLSYFFSFFLQYCTWLIVTVSIVGVYAFGIFISVKSWQKYKSIKTEDSSSKQATHELLANANFYKYVSITLWCLLSLLFLITLCLFSRIKLAVQIIQAAAEFVSEEKGIILVPITIFLVQVAYLAIWLFGLAAIFSTGDLEYNPNYPWGKIKLNDALK